MASIFRPRRYHLICHYTHASRACILTRVNDIALSTMHTASPGTMQAIQNGMPKGVIRVERARGKCQHISNIPQSVHTHIYGKYFHVYADADVNRPKSVSLFSVLKTSCTCTQTSNCNKEVDE